MRGLKIRIGRYKWLAISFFLLNAITLSFLAQNDFYYFRAKQLYNVSQNQQYSYVELPHADQVIRKILLHKDEVQDYNFIIEYYQNIPSNPLNRVLVTWESNPERFNFPTRKQVSQEAAEMPILVGREVYERLHAEQQDDLQINGEHFSVDKIVGERGVQFGAFDDVVIINGKLISNGFSNYIPPNRYITICFLDKEGKTVLNLLEDIGVKLGDSDVETNKGLPLDTTAYERVSGNGELLRKAISGLFIIFIIAGITVFIVGKYFIDQSRQDVLIKSVLGMKNIKNIWVFIKNNLIMLIGVNIFVISLQGLCIYFDWGYFYKIRPSSYNLFLLEQIIIQLIFIVAFAYQNINILLTDVTKRSR